MKTRIVIWGSNDENEKLLIAIALNADENKLDIYTFPEKVATEEFYNLMINTWRNGSEFEIPAEHTHIERPLSVTESLLPDNLKVDRTDVIQRAQAEWHFVVLSAKLYQAYQSELSDIKEKIEQVSEFDDQLWEELKSFWGKVQDQINEKNLFRDHGRTLREKTNNLFTKLKEHRKKLDSEFKARSEENKAQFMNKLHEIEERIKSGMGLQPIFNELKDIQQEYRNTGFTRDDRSKVWDRLDKAFKAVKEKKYGTSKDGGRGSSALERIERRYKGLLSAIEKMERSIGRDRSDMDFQDKRIAESEGQLEAQIRQAKIKMVEERINSKDAKLQDMLKTKDELEQRIEQEKVREAKRQEQKKVEEAKKAAKAKIAEEIKEAAKERAPEAEKLEKAAEEISAAKKPRKEPVAEVPKEESVPDATKEEPPVKAPKVEDAKPEEQKSEETHKSAEKNEGVKKESLLGAIATTMGESMQDVGDTIKAVAQVVGDKIEDALDGDDDEAEDPVKQAFSGEEE